MLRRFRPQEGSLDGTGRSHCDVGLARATVFERTLRERNNLRMLKDAVQHMKLSVGERRTGNQAVKGRRQRSEFQHAKRGASPYETRTYPPDCGKSNAEGRNQKEQRYGLCNPVNVWKIVVSEAMLSYCKHIQRSRCVCPDFHMQQ